jgi:hypothetical protein
MSSLARFPYRLLVELGETSKWEVQETGKAPEPPNSKNWVWARHTAAVSALHKIRQFSSDIPPTPRPAFPY